MSHHSPKTGRFISNATYARWYAPKQEKRREYTKAVRRWSKHRKEKEAPARKAREAPSRPAAKVERIVKLKSTRKARRGGGHLTLMDVRVFVPANWSDAQIMAGLRNASRKEPTELEARFVSWKHGEQGKVKEGSTRDLPLFAPIIQSSETETSVEDEEEIIEGQDESDLD
jgi:hypothetical protein